MTDKDIETYIMKRVKLIEVNPESIKEATDRSGQFLIAQSVLTTLLKGVEVNLAKTLTIKEAVYAQCIDESAATNITKQKADAEANPSYAAAREEHEKLEAKRKYLRSFIDIFKDAHVMYRQISNSKE